MCKEVEEVETERNLLREIKFYFGMQFIKTAARG